VCKDWFIEVIGEQELVDRARELDKTPLFNELRDELQRREE
jgi:hypothetical protein